MTHERWQWQVCGIEDSTFSDYNAVQMPCQGHSEAADKCYNHWDMVSPSLVFNGVVRRRSISGAWHPGGPTQIVCTDRMGSHKTLVDVPQSYIDEVRAYHDGK